MGIFDFILVCMATYYLGRAWHVGELFAPVRAHLQAQEYEWPATLARCSLCTSFYIGIFVVIYGVLLPSIAPAFVACTLRLAALYAPAAACASYVIGQVMSRFVNDPLMHE